jgi:hypothetical protein
VLRLAVCHLCFNVSGACLPACACDVRKDGASLLVSAYVHVFGDVGAYCIWEDFWEVPVFVCVCVCPSRQCLSVCPYVCAYAAGTVCVSCVVYSRFGSALLRSRVFLFVPFRSGARIAA